MILSVEDLRSRSFLIQFYEIIMEFGKEIPWLAPLINIGFSTDSIYFRDQILKKLGCEEEGIMPYQFIAPETGKYFVGGLLHFSKSPENFKSSVNRDIQEKLESEKAAYISCLQIRQPFRFSGNGKELMERTLRVILKEHGKVWGVVAHPELLSMYTGLGARVHSTLHNKDKLAVISWSNQNALDS